jgi:hypothetical protein
MMRPAFANSPLVSALVFFGAIAIAFMATKSRNALPLLAMGLPALHGGLTARSALQSLPLPTKLTSYDALRRKSGINSTPPTTTDKS